jgi:hypothetical protein
MRISARYVAYSARKHERKEQNTLRSPRLFGVKLTTLCIDFEMPKRWSDGSDQKAKIARARADEIEEG